MNTTHSDNAGNPAGRPLSIGDPFPDTELVDHTGAVWKPSDAAGEPLVLILHRHLA